MRHRMLVVATAALLVVTACGGGGDDAGDDPTTTAPTAQGTGIVEEGERLFDKTCIACHGEGGKGVDGLGKPLRASEFLGGMTEEAVAAFLAVGRPSSDALNTTGIDMPPKGGNPALSDQDLADIAAYLLSLQG